MTIVYPHYLESIGGGERYLINIINLLPDTYNKVLITPHSNSELEKNITSKFDKISTSFLRNFGPFPSISMSLFTALLKIIKKDNNCLIHINDYYLLPTILLVKVLFGIKVIFTSHGKWDTYFWINRVILKMLNPVVLVATDVQRQRVDSLVDKVIFMPFFTLFGTRNFIKINDNEKLRLGIVGRFSPVKNHFLALEVINCLDKHKYELHIFGDKTLDIAEEGKSYQQELESRIKASRSTVWHGFVSDESDIYKHFDILLVTSHSESFGMTTVEALSVGIPVISTKTEGALSLLSHGVDGLLCDNNIDSFINAIQIIESNYGIYSQNAKQSSMKYSPERYLQKLEELYGS